MSSVKVDFGASAGSIKPLHGLNNGPVGYGGLVDVSHYYRELRVPFVRLHDTSWPHPREVDVPQIFPNFDADPDDPASYDFRRTDAYIQRILDTGAKIVYRLGTSIEHTPIKYYTHPPADFDKWARICIGIIKHYTRGWADGMDGGVHCWEIWNEPETGRSMWTGTFEQYLEVYKTAASAIKAFDPSLKVGGFGVAYSLGSGPSRTCEFLDFCRANSVPLDFFSWHTYVDVPEQIADNARVVREALDERGFTATESHFNEWNFMPSFAEHGDEPGGEYVRREYFEQQKGEVGASFAAAVLTLLQDQKVDMANYYDGQPVALYCGLFDYYGVPQKTFRAFKAFSHMLSYSERVHAETISSDDNLYALAAVDPKARKAGVLISRFNGETDECVVELAGIPAGDDVRCEVLILDKDRDLEPVVCSLNPAEPTLRILLRKHSVALIKLNTG